MVHPKVGTIGKTKIQDIGLIKKAKQTKRTKTLWSTDLTGITTVSVGKHKNSNEVKKGKYNKFKRLSERQDK